VKGPIVRKNRARSSLIKDPEILNEGRERLMDVALDLFGELGFHQTSVRTIAERAGISVGTLFNYFGGKDELLLHLINHGQEVWERPMQPLQAELDQAIERRADPADLLGGLFGTYVRMVHETRRYVLLAYQETKSLVTPARRELFDRESRLVAIFERALLYGADKGLWPHESLWLKAHSIVMLAQIWAIRRWLLSQHVSSVEQYAREITPMILGIARGSADARGPGPHAVAPADEADAAPPAAARDKPVPRPRRTKAANWRKVARSDR
jgi:TetR/AcrR family transcriptional regulator, cholesterol catabolism regulator